MAYSIMEVSPRDGRAMAGIDSLLAREGLGCLLSFDKLVDTGPDSPLCFRPLRPPLYSRLFFVWKKYAVFSPAAAVLLDEMKSRLDMQVREKNSDAGK